MWPCGAVVAGSREMEGDKAWLRSQCRAGPAWPWGHKLQPNWRVPWRPHCYWAEDRGGDWRGGPFPSLSLSSPEAPSAGTILVLAKDCGERCLTVSIYARHSQDINNLFPCCSAHCFHWCILWLWNWCLTLHCLNQLFTSSLLEHQFYFTLHTCLLPFFFFLLSHLPSVLGSSPTISSSEHPDSTLDFLTACVLVCLTCKPLRCLISYFGFQSAKHVDMLSAHLGVFLCLSPCVIALFLFILLPLSPVSSWTFSKWRSRLVLSGPEPGPVFNFSVHFIFQLKCLQTGE